MHPTNQTELWQAGSSSEEVGARRLASVAHSLVFDGEIFSSQRGMQLEGESEGAEEGWKTSVDGFFRFPLGAKEIDGERECSVHFEDTPEGLPVKEADHVTEQTGSSNRTAPVDFKSISTGLKSKCVSEPSLTHCTCKKNRCLLLYCQCMRSRVECSKSCKCVDCFNNEHFADLREVAVEEACQRNPHAFHSKLESNSDSDLAQFFHSRGCRCKKSNCMKKYCECFQMGVSCTEKCGCSECENNKVERKPSFNDSTKTRKPPKTKSSFIRELLDIVK